MNFTDTHCHLDATKFGDSQAAGVERIVVPSVARASFEAVRKLGMQFPDCPPAYGIHQICIGDTMPEDLDATLPLENIVLETDAPGIPPAFLQTGEPNKPEHLPRIAQTLAELRGVPLEEIAEVTTANALAVLPSLKPSHL